MRMNPTDFFEDFVTKNYDDCRSNIGSIRYAFNAAVSASHLADHYFNYFQKHDPSKIKKFASKNEFINYLSEKTKGGFQDIWSISNAYKHLYSTNVHWTITSPGVIEIITILDQDSTVQRIVEDWNSDVESRVVFTRKDGKTLDFLDTLKTVIEFWEKLLAVDEDL